MIKLRNIFYPILIVVCFLFGTEVSYPIDTTEGEINKSYQLIVDNYSNDEGKIQWAKFYHEFIQTKSNTGQKLRYTSHITQNIAKIKKEKFIESEYRKYQHFNLWTLEAYGTVDSTVFLYVKKQYGNIVIRRSDNIQSPIVIVKTKYGWMLDYEYQINHDMYTRYDLYEYKHTLGFLSSSNNLFVEEEGCRDLFGEYYIDIWDVTPNRIKYMTGLELSDSMTVMSDTKDFAECVLNCPMKYQPRQIKEYSNQYEMVDGKEILFDEFGNTKFIDNPLFIGSGGALNEFTVDSDNFLIKEESEPRRQNIITK